MPPLPRLTLPVLVDLAAQMRYAPPDVVRRAIDRAEELASQVDADGAYPNEWVVYWITRYRPEAKAGDSPQSVTGMELLSQISAFVEHLCDSAQLREAEYIGEAGEAGAAKGAFVTPEELAGRWNISRKTLDRYRWRGLVARRVRGAKGKIKVLLNAKAAELFRARHGEQIKEAAGYSRIDEPTRARMVEQAARYQSRLGYSLNQAAARLAERFGRSHETIRQLLLKHSVEATRPGTRSPGKEAEKPLQAGIPPISPRDRDVAYRAWQRAIEPGNIARHLGHAKPAVLRGILLERLELLRGQQANLISHAGPTFEMQGADQVLLGPTPVRTCVYKAGETDLASFLAACRTRVVPVGAEETSRAIAYHFLLWRSSRAIAKVSHLHPSASAIDAIETDLRWAARLKALLVRAQLPLMIQTLEGRLESPLHALRPPDTVAMIGEGIRAISEVIHAFDPLRAVGTGAKLAGAVSPAITRLAAAWARRAVESPSRGRATAVYSLAQPMEDWTRSLCAWQSFLEPDRRVRLAAETQGPAARSFLERRFGWGDSPPRTLAWLAKDLGLTPMRTGTIERNYLREALASWRAKLETPKSGRG